jgi:hypothetical protein
MYPESYDLPYLHKEVEHVRVLLSTSRVLFLSCGDLPFQYENIVRSAGRQIAQTAEISLRNDLSIKSVPFSPFKLCFSDIIEVKKNLNAKRIISDIVKDITRSEFLSTLAKSLNVGQNYQETCKISDDANNVMIALERYSKKLNPLFVINEISLFDAESVELIYMLISHSLDSNYPAISRAKFVFVDYDFSNSLYDKIKLFDHSEYVIKDLPIDDAKILIGRLTPFLLSTDDTLMVYKMCGKQISKIVLMCKYLCTEPIVNTGFDTNGFRKTLYEILENRIEKLKKCGLDISTVLNSAAEIAEVIGEFDLLELGKLFQDISEEHIADVMSVSDREYLTETKNMTSRFVHEIILDYFLIKNEKDKKRVNIQIEQAIKYFRPGSFILRAIHLSRAGKLEDTLVLYILQYIKDTLASNPSTVLVNDLENIEGKIGHALGFDFFAKFFAAYKNLEYRQAYEIMQSDMTILHPKLLLAKYYLAALCIKKIGVSATDMREAIGVAEKVCEESQYEEPYIWELSTSLLVSLCINYDGDKSKARTYYRSLVLAYSKRLKYDSDAKIGLYVLYRKASAVYSPEFAVNYTKESVEYFRNTINYSQLLMSLNNHSGNLLVLGRYDEARAVLSEVMDILADGLTGSAFYLYILNNYLVACLLLGIDADKIEKALHLHLDKVKGCDAKAIPLINLAVYYAACGSLKKARDCLEEAVTITKIMNDDYYDYYIYSNIASILYLENMKPEAIAIFDKYCSKAPSLTPNTQFHLYDRRYLFLRELFIAKREFSPFEFTRPVLDISGDASKSDFYNRGFICSDIQFWSES